MRSIKIVSLYQPGGQKFTPQSGSVSKLGRGVSSGVSLGGGPGLCLMHLRQKAERERLCQDELRSCVVIQWVLSETFVGLLVQIMLSGPRCFHERGISSGNTAWGEKEIQAFF